MRGMCSDRGGQSGTFRLIDRMSRRRCCAPKALWDDGDDAKDRVRLRDRRVFRCRSRTCRRRCGRILIWRENAEFDEEYEGKGPSKRRFNWPELFLLDDASPHDWPRWIEPVLAEGRIPGEACLRRCRSCDVDNFPPKDALPSSTLSTSSS